MLTKFAELQSRVRLTEIDRTVSAIMMYTRSANFATRLVRVAQAELGNGESGGNNVGGDVRRYQTSLLTGKRRARGPWCAAFVSWCLERAWQEYQNTSGILDVTSPPVKRSHSAKTLWRRGIAAGERVQVPRPGDIACWDRGVKGSWQGHVGIVERVERGGKFTCIEGNRGKYPAEVDRFDHAMGEGRLMGFARIVLK